jgi:hypothetical protein
MQSSSVLMPALSQLQPNGGTLADDRGSGFLHRST